LKQLLTGFRADLTTRQHSVIVQSLKQIDSPRPSAVLCDLCVD